MINCSSRSADLHLRLGYGAVANAVIHNGYDPDFFCPDDATRAAKRGELGVAETTFLIGNAGRWHAQKDIPNLLGAMRLLREQGVPITCLLVGAGLDLDNAELAAEIRSAGCADDVILAGAQPDVRDYYRAMDLHVLASSGSEAFPNVVAESMLCGAPNVATDVGDSASIVGDAGFVVPPRDPGRMAEAISRAWREWSDDQQRWQQRRIAARRRIAERFTFERMVTAYQAVWKKVARGT